jgi:hypothetical protein
LVRWKDFDVSHDTWIRWHSVTPLSLQAYEEFLTTHAEAFRRLAARTHHKSDITRAQSARKHLESFIGRAGAVASASETSDVAQNTTSAEFEVDPVVSSTGRVVRRPVHYKDARR